MPPLPPVSQCISIQLTWTDQNDLNVTNRFHVAYAGAAPSQTQLDTYTTQVHGAAVTNLAPQYVPAVQLTQITVTDLGSVFGLRSINNTAIPGTNTGGAAAPSGMAVLMNAKVGRRYRGGKPRLYLPIGNTNAFSGGNQWNSTLVSGSQSAWNAFIAQITNVTAGGWQVANNVNVSYYQGFTAVTSPTTGRARNVPKLRTNPITDPITGWTTNPIIGSQRRRYGRSK